MQMCSRCHMILIQLVTYVQFRMRTAVPYGCRLLFAASKTTQGGVLFSNLVILLLHLFSEMLRGLISIQILEFDFVFRLQQVRPLKQGGDFLFPYKTQCERLYNFKHYFMVVCRNKFILTALPLHFIHLLQFRSGQHTTWAFKKKSKYINLSFEYRDMVSTQEKI